MPKLHPAHLRPASTHATKIALLLSLDLWPCSLSTVLAHLEETFILPVILYSQIFQSFSMTHSRSQDPFAFVIAQNGTLSYGAVSLTFSQMIQWSLSYINKHPNPCPYPYPYPSRTTNPSIPPFLPPKTHQSSHVQYSQAWVCRTRTPLVSERRRLNN